MVARAAGAGQQRTPPAERETTGKGSARAGSEGKQGQFKLPEITENCISALNLPAIPQQKG